MVILTREQIDEAEKWYTPLPFDGDIPDDLRGAFDTARAFHDLRDAVLALHVKEDASWGTYPVPEWRCKTCGSLGWPCATVQAVESVGGAR